MQINYKKIPETKGKEFFTKINLQETIAELQLDVEYFKQLFVKDFNLMKAFEESTDVIYSEKGYKPEDIKETIFSETEWSLFLMRLQDTDKTTVNFFMLGANYVDMPELISKEKSSNFKNITLKQKFISRDDDIMVINDLKPDEEEAYAQFLANRIANFRDYEWNVKKEQDRNI